MFGGVLIFAGVHVWTADTQTKEQRAAWTSTLDQIAAPKPSVIVPGHMTPEAKMDLSAVQYTKDYLVAFEEEIERAANSAALKTAMESLEIGSKVAMNEMKWV